MSSVALHLTLGSVVHYTHAGGAHCIPATIIRDCGDWHADLALYIHGAPVQIRYTVPFSWGGLEKNTWHYIGRCNE